MNEYIESLVRTVYAATTAGYNLSFEDGYSSIAVATSYNQRMKLMATDDLLHELEEKDIIRWDQHGVRIARKTYLETLEAIKEREGGE